MDMVNSSLGTPKGNTALTDSARDRLIVALDFLSSEQAETLITQLNDRVNFYKVGQPLFTSAGPKLLEFLKKENKKIFFDFKSIDIPTTVGNLIKVIARHGVTFATVEGNSDGAIMKAAVAARDEAVTEGCDRVNILCVTALHISQTKTPWQCLTKQSMEW